MTITPSTRFILLTVLLVTLAHALIYACFQQMLRIEANDPQIQQAEDASVLLSQGIVFATTTDAVDMQHSLAPFYMIFDNKHNIIQSTGLYNGAPITPPSGVLDYTLTHPENRLTWQPKQDTRLAAVVTHYQSSSGSGFVLVARSLRETKNRITTIGHFVMASWLGSLLLCLIAATPWKRRGQTES